MLIILWNQFGTSVIESIVTALMSVLIAVGPIIIMIIGLELLLSAPFGRAPHRFTGRLFHEIAILLIRVIHHLIRGAVRVLRSFAVAVFAASREALIQRGLTAARANLVASLITALVVIIII